MSDGPVVYRRDERGVVTLTMNRPANFNALGEEMLAALQAALDRVADDQTARVVVLAAEGKAFCPGHNLKEMIARPELAHYQQLFAQCNRVMLSILKLPVPAYTRGPEIRELIETYWMPRLEAFRPEMVFISAGFDAHREDDLGQLGLVEQDYVWITSRIKDIARKHAKGRIVSSLEGGYNLDALGRSVEAHLRALADL